MSQSVYNLISKAVLSEKAECEVLNYVAIGTKMYQTFLKGRVTGEKSIWEKNDNIPVFRQVHKDKT